MAVVVSDIMERCVKTIHCQCSVRDAEAFLAEHGISGAPMVSTDGHVLGVVSVTDVTRFRYEHAQDDPADHMVFEIGTPITVTVEAGASLREAATEMTRNQVHRLVVVSAGRPIGIVSALDLVAQMARGAA